MGRSRKQTSPGGAALFRGLHLLVALSLKTTGNSDIIVPHSESSFMTSKRVCAFCPETANLTGEHMFADWIDRILTTTTSHYVFTDTDPKSGAIRKWRGRHLNRKFNAVCDRCNNGWMSDIDNAARDTLKDVIRYRAPVSFLRRGLESIAAFTLKNAFVADYMHDQPFFGLQARNRFKEHRQFPLGVYMWLGGVITERKVKNGLMKSRYGKPAIDSPERNSFVRFHVVRRESSVTTCRHALDECSYV